MLAVAESFGAFVDDAVGAAEAANNAAGGDDNACLSATRPAVLKAAASFQALVVSSLSDLFAVLLAATAQRWFFALVAASPAFLDAASRKVAAVLKPP